jgi:hypothetical protein
VALAVPAVQVVLAALAPTARRPATTDPELPFE